MLQEDGLQPQQYAGSATAAGAASGSIPMDEEKNHERREAACASATGVPIAATLASSRRLPGRLGASWPKLEYFSTCSANNSARALLDYSPASPRLTSPFLVRHCAEQAEEQQQLSASLRSVLRSNVPMAHDSDDSQDSQDDEESEASTGSDIAYEAAEITGERWHRESGVHQYRVRWHGLPGERWEDATDFEGFPTEAAWLRRREANSSTAHTAPSWLAEYADVTEPPHPAESPQQPPHPAESPPQPSLPAESPPHPSPPRPSPALDERSRPSPRRSHWSSPARSTGGSRSISPTTPPPPPPPPRYEHDVHELLNEMNAR